MTDEGWIRVDGMRGLRYCEVLTLRIVEARLNAEVWNTIGLNDCPHAAWDALDDIGSHAAHGTAKGGRRYTGVRRGIGRCLPTAT